MKCIRSLLVLPLLLFFAVIPEYAIAASAGELTRDAQNSLKRLVDDSSKVLRLSREAKAVLVFPAIVKAGFLVGGQYGEGVLLRDGEPAGFYNTVAVSYGLQIGAQKYGYALFFMTDDAMKYLDKSDGWELGTAPSIVVLDSGASGGISTTTAQSDMYAFFFSQKGLMAGLGLQGTKITKIEK